MCKWAIRSQMRGNIDALNRGLLAAVTIAALTPADGTRA